MPTEIWPLTDGIQGPRSISMYKNPYFRPSQVNHNENEEVETYTLAMLPIPFTIPIAAARFLEKVNLQYMEFKCLTYAGGRGIAFETHTSVIAKPFSK